MNIADMDEPEFCDAVVAAIGKLPEDGRSSVSNATLYLLAGIARDIGDADLLEGLMHDLRLQFGD